MIDIINACSSYIGTMSCALNDINMPIKDSTYTSIVDDNVSGKILF